MYSISFDYILAGHIKKTDCRTTQIAWEYQGELAETIAGHMCQRWDSQSPNAHSITAGQLPEKNLNAAGNYCRNPTRVDTGLWCYLADSVGTGSCYVPLCGELC